MADVVQAKIEAQEGEPQKEHPAEDTKDGEEATSRASESKNTKEDCENDELVISDMQKHDSSKDSEKNGNNDNQEITENKTVGNTESPQHSKEDLDDSMDALHSPDESSQNDLSASNFNKEPLNTTDSENSNNLVVSDSTGDCVNVSNLSHKDSVDDDSSKDPSEKSKISDEQTESSNIETSSLHAEHDTNSNNVQEILVKNSQTLNQSSTNIQDEEMDELPDNEDDSNSKSHDQESSEAPNNEDICSDEGDDGADAKKSEDNSTSQNKEKSPSNEHLMEVDESSLLSDELHSRKDIHTKSESQDLSMEVDCSPNTSKLDEVEDSQLNSSEEVKSTISNEDSKDLPPTSDQSVKIKVEIDDTNDDNSSKETDIKNHQKIEDSESKCQCSYVDGKKDCHCAKHDVKEEEDSSEVKNKKKPSEKTKESSAKASETSQKDSKGDKKVSESDSEIKGYITDTMNELLGLFGYEKVDESTKSKLQLGKKTETPTRKEYAPGPNFTKQKSESAKSDTPKKSRCCAECSATKGLKFQVLFQGTTRYLCSDKCFQIFRGKQKLAQKQPPATPPTTATPSSTTSTPSSTPASTPTPTTLAPAAVPSPVVHSTLSSTPLKEEAKDEIEMCTQCKREIKNNQGFFPPTGENKPLCSEDCMQKYQQTHGPKQVCAQCKNNIQGRNKCLTWETMEFCNEDCLGKYQAYLGSHCTCCQVPVQQSSLGKYCVRFGSDIRQFCSGRCLEEFKKGLKVCSFCQKDLSSGQDGFLAPVGDKGQFKDFCTQQCMERYENMNSTTSTTPQAQQCSYCKRMAPVKVTVKFEEKDHNLCSDQCIARFRYFHKINTTICDTCHKFFDPEKNSQPFNLQFEGSTKRYCTKACMNLFVLSHRKIVPCTWCKVKKYNFDMIERVDSSNQVQLFCSLNCLSLFRVSLNATSSRCIVCDHCQKNLPAQYHLTMSDASIRNFCSYQCVIQFQSQFTNVPTLTTTTPTARQNSNQSTTKNTVQNSQASSSTPVISSVMSLAPAQSKVLLPKSTVTPTSKPVPQSISVSRPQPPPLAIIATKAATSVTTTTTQSTISSPSTNVVREVIVKPPPPKSLRNKTILCKPIMQTKGVSCKPHPCHKAVQTDGNPEVKSIIVPIPVPIYMPTPVHMYSRPVPCPFPFPLPIPIPMFIPTGVNSPEQVLKQIKEIQEKIPDNPFEAELLMMAEMIADNEEKKEKDEKTDTDQDEKCGSETGKSVLNSTVSEDIPEPVMDLEAVLLPVPSFPLREQENGSTEESVISPRSLRTPRQRGSKRRGSGRGRGRGRGRKRARVEVVSEEDSDSFLLGELDSNPPTPVQPSVPDTVSVAPDANLCLKFTFGVNAWKHWVLEKNAQLEKGSQSSRKLKLFKTDLLQLPPDELNYSLCLFVKEVRKPNGEEYAPDSIYYLCLGIQQYLFENGRIDNIFTDAYYEKFTECLNEVIQKQDVITTTEGIFISRIEEDILWESKQLGAHSPHVLLNTLMYFNTKFFMLKTVDDHMHLSFSHITKHWRKNMVVRSSSSNSGARNVVLRYFPPVNKEQRRRREDIVYEQAENIDNPLRCPVKLYEFYLSKCPESVKTRNDVFYLYPERSCVPDSPVWYATQALGRETVCKMMQRIKMVREITEAFQEVDDDFVN